MRPTTLHAAVLGVHLTTFHAAVPGVRPTTLHAAVPGGRIAAAPVVAIGPPACSLPRGG